MATHSKGSLLLLIVCVAVCSVTGQFDCEQEFLTAQDCFRQLDDRIIAATKHAELCETDTYVSIEQCGDIVLQQCPDKEADIKFYKDNTETSFTDKCRVLQEALPKPTAAPPPTEQSLECNEDGWTTVNKHMARCMNQYQRLDQFTYASKLTKYGMCRSVQNMLDCMLEKQEINKCPMFYNALGTQLIPYVNFGHLLGCSLKLSDKAVYNRNQDTACNLWDWLGCHNSLFSTIPELKAIDANTDLYSIMNFMTYKLNADLASKTKACNPYNKVDWSGIRNCRAKMAEKCQLLDNPRSDTLWNNVRDAMYELKQQLYDNVYSMMKIEQICDPACSDQITREAKIDTCFTAAGDERGRTIIDMFNNGKPNLSANPDCGKMRTLKTCLLRDDVIGQCAYLSQVVVVRLHNYNSWKLAFDICKIDLDIEAEHRCISEDTIAGDILSKCSLRSQQLSLLHDGYEKPEDVFCYFLQKSTSCYEQYMSKCPAHERKFWAAEQPIVAAANQMLSKCDANFLNYGKLKIAAIDQTSCDMTKVVRCLGDLWTALGVSIPADNKLPLEGFKALLALMWNYGDRNDHKARCQKVRGIDFRKMKQCVSNLTMTCNYPRMTVEDGYTHQQFLPNPFNISQIANFVTKSCEPHCIDTDIGKEVLECLDYEKDLTVINTYPHDIIYLAFTRQHDKSKCATIKPIKVCVEYRLDSTKCSLYNSNIVQTPAYNEAIDICNKPPKTDDPGDNETGLAPQSAVASSVLLVTSVILAYVM